MNVFIAGCARSGTSLILKLMGCFDDTFLVRTESSLRAFVENAGRAKHIVVKRNAGAYKSLSALPRDVHLIYCVRHPFDVLTSSHPETVAKRPFHVTSKRWLDEYRAWRQLLQQQPERRFFLLRYEDLVADPDRMQAAIAGHFGLSPALPFSQNPDEQVHSGSLRKWESRPELAAYLRTLEPAFVRDIERFCGEFGYGIPQHFFARRSKSRPLAVKRLVDGPIIRPDMLRRGVGENINGPSLIRAPSWVAKPLGRYYLYFAHHKGDHIRMAYADRLEGPWKIHRGGVLSLAQAPMCRGHIASPDVHVDKRLRQIVMTFHGQVGGREQRSFLARSADGLRFRVAPAPVGEPYLRLLSWRGGLLGMAAGGAMFTSDRATKAMLPLGHPVFQGEPISEERYVRHVALRRIGGTLEVFYTMIGDTPERIWRCSIDLAEPREQWRARGHEVVLAPAREWEGSLLPVVTSRKGIVRAPEHALRDPAIFAEDGVTYLLYAVAGEQGIGIARLEEGGPTPDIVKREEVQRLPERSRQAAD